MENKFTEYEINEFYKSFYNSTGKRIEYEGRITKKEKVKNNKAFIKFLSSPQSKQLMGDKTCDMLIGKAKEALVKNTENF